MVTGDRLADKDRLGQEPWKLVGVAAIRGMLAQCLPGAEFHPPTRLDGKCAVGLTTGQHTFLAEAATFWEAYQRVSREVGPD